MKIARTFIIMVMALLVLVPLCGCGKVLTWSGHSSAVPCCPCEGGHESEDKDAEEDCGGCGDCECKQACLLTKTFFLGHSKDASETYFEEKAAKQDTVDDFHFLARATHIAHSSFVEPPWGDLTPIWKLCCNYRL